MEEHIMNDLWLVPAPGVLSLYVRRSSKKLDELIGTFVDDCLNVENVSLEKLSDLTLSKFDFKSRVYDAFNFYETQLVMLDGCCFHLSQKHYASNMMYVEKNCSFDEYRNDRAFFSWLCHTRSDVACHENKAAQMTEKTYSNEKVLELNKEIRKIKSNA